MKTYTKILVAFMAVSIAAGVSADPISLPLKWSQPPVGVAPPTDPPTFIGWDEPSMEPFPIVADDFLCKGPLPVVGVHWWGSYLNWTGSVAPLSPDAFMIRFWSNVPVGPNNPYDFSYPGELLHEIRCEIYREEFVGYDIHPDDPGIVQDATFQYTQIFDETEWFWQDPISVEPGIYWISISALYLNPTADVIWGWKSRPWYFEDDAVRSSLITPLPGWEPIIGPDGNSWDMSFELYTIPEPGMVLVGALAISVLMRRRT